MTQASDDEDSSDDNESTQGEKNDDDTLLSVPVPAASKDSSSVDRDEAHCEVSDVPIGVRVQSAFYQLQLCMQSSQIMLRYPATIGTNKYSQDLYLMSCNLCWMVLEGHYGMCMLFGWVGSVSDT